MGVHVSVDVATGEQVTREPTAQEIGASAAKMLVIQQQEAAETVRQTEGAQARQSLVAIAQGAVGLAPADWTNTQFRALLALVIWERGGLGGDQTLRPLVDWLRD